MVFFFEIDWIGAFIASSSIALLVYGLLYVQNKPPATLSIR
jgi:hypothetical protein